MKVYRYYGKLDGKAYSGFTTGNSSEEIVRDLFRNGYKNIVVRVEREDSNRTFTQEEKYQSVKGAE